MSDYSGLLTIGASLVGGLSAPKAPKIDSYNPTPIEKKSLNEYLPEIDKLMSSQADVALSMLNGEIPQSVQDQVKMFAGESAMRGGFSDSTTRTSNVTARDLGLSALDMMQQGQGYANYLVRQTRDIMADDLAIDVSNANMAYDAWASGAQIQMDQWRGDSSRHANIMGGITSGLGQLSTARQLGLQREQSQMNFNALLETLG